ncbi:hypothetical protein GCM10009080_51290 [Cupriavidus pauculus]
MVGPISRNVPRRRTIQLPSASSAAKAGAERVPMVAAASAMQMEEARGLRRAVVTVVTVVEVGAVVMVVRH